MNFYRLRAIIKKEIFHITRERKTLIAAFAIPVLLIFLFCDSLSLDVENISLALMDKDNSRQSRELACKFSSGGYFNIIAYPENYAEVNKLFESAGIAVCVAIPSGFSRDISRGGSSIQILVDGTDPSRSGTALNYISSIIQNYISSVSLNSDPANIKVITPEIRFFYNPSLKSKNAVIPGLIAIIMAILSALLTSVSISREWENSSMELLLSAPVSALEIIAGKFIPYFIIGLIDCFILILIGNVIYDVPIKGSFILLIAVCMIFLSSTLLQGLAISIVTRNSLVSNLVALLSSFLPTMILSGFVFCISDMPKVIQYITYLVPGKYFISCSRNLFLKAAGIEIIIVDILFLLIFNLIVFGVCLSKFKKTLD